MSARSRTVLVVPGLDDFAVTRWPQRVPGVRRVAAVDRSVPDLNRWAASVATAIDGCREAPLVVAHGFGALAALRATFLFERRVAGMMLVAPDDPDRHGVLARLPATPLPYPTLVVASRDDRGIKITKAGALATRWGSRLVVTDRLDDDRWPEGDRLLRAFAAELVPRAIANAA